MHFIKFRHMPFVMLLVCSTASGCRSGAPSAPGHPGDAGNSWTVTDLGPGRLVALNSSGVLVGIDNNFQTFTVTAAGTKTSIPAFDAGSSTIGTAIDSAGNVVGYSEGLGGRIAVQTIAGAWTAIAGLGTSWSEAIGVGDPGEIYGVAGTGTIAEMRAFSLSGPLPLPTDKDSAAYLGSGGNVAGIVETASGDTHAFLISNGALTDLGTLGGTDSAPYGMSGQGDVVGASEAADGSRHAFHVAPGGAMVNLGIPAGDVASDARGIDDQGRIAGNAFDATGLSHPIVFLNGGTTVDLMPLDSSNKPFVSANVAAMSADGHIVGWGTSQDTTNGATHCILWTPEE